MRKAISGSFILLLLVTILSTGCESTANPTAAKGPTAITFWTFMEQHGQFFSDAAASWNKVNKDRQINLAIQVYPYDEMHSKLQIALQSGSGAPDMVDIEASRYSIFLNGNISLVPLNSIVEPVKDFLVMDRLENYAKNGNYYGIDYHVGVTVAYYNKEILAKAGVNPDDIKLWSDFIEAGKKVKAATGKPMMTVEVKNMWTFYPMISQLGSNYLDKDGNVIVDNEINIRVLQYLKDMIYKYKIAIPAPGGEHYTEDYFAFMSKGGAASVIMPIWFMGRFTDYMPELKGKMVIKPMPAWTEGGSRTAGMGGTGTSITIQSKNQELAKEFLAAAKLSKGGSLKTWTLLGFDPIRKDVYNMPELNVDNKYTEYFGKGIMDVVKSVKDEINPVNLGPLYPDATMYVNRTTLFKVLSEQSLTPEDGLKKAALELRSEAGK
jgi:arabinosaccharide transport system substrate-binding protein